MGPRILHYSDVENAYDDPERIARLAGLLQRLRDEESLVAGTGDNTSPGVLPLVCEGRQALDFFEAVAPDVETFGNHDFDYGPDATLDVVRESPQTWVATNARRNGDRFGADAGTVPWTVRQSGGAAVGFLGLTDPRTPSINPNADGVTFEDPVAAGREAVAALRDRGVDHVVVLSHCGRQDEELAVELDVDVILGGHVHSEVVERVSDTLLTRPGVNGSVVLEVRLDGEAAVTRHAVADAPANADVAAALRERKAAADLGAVVATVEDPIERTERTAFRGESRVGNFVADAYRAVAGGDVGLQNSGGIRSGPPLSGDVTVGDLVSVVPFEEPLAVAEVTGERLRAAFRQGHGASVGFGEPEWWHAHVSGARLVWDRNDRMIESATVGGEPVDPGATYTLATSEYVFYTDHEFPALREDHVVDRLDPQYEVLVEYARRHGIEAAIEGRIVRREE